MFSKVFFIGQNSHGTSLPWQYRSAIIDRYSSLYDSIAVAIECPTTDLLFYQLGKLTSSSELEVKEFLDSSSYWWLQSNEFLRFISTLKTNIDCYGIDVPFYSHEFTKKVHSKLTKINSPLISCLKKLIERDLHVDTFSYSHRELIMKDKLQVIMNSSYDLIFVLCHNFHASKKSWLYYESLCQSIINGHNCNIFSCSTYSRSMHFLSSHGDKKVYEYYLDNCIRQTSNDTYIVKNISSYYTGNSNEIYVNTINTPDLFDEIVILPNDHRLTMEWMD